MCELEECKKTETVINSYEERMKDYVRSGEWIYFDEKHEPHYLGVYLCLNILVAIPKGVKEHELMKIAKEFLMKHQIRYNPLNMSIDAVAQNGLNLGVEVDERDFDKINENNEFAIANALKEGCQFKPDYWVNRELRFDCRAGKGGKRVSILNK